MVAPTDGAYQVMAAGPAAAGPIKGPPTWGAYMCNYTYVLPKDVSFWKITVGEQNVQSKGAGSLAGSSPWVWGWGPKPVGTGNINTGCLVLGPNNPGDFGTTLPWDRVAAEVGTFLLTGPGRSRR